VARRADIIGASQRIRSERRQQLKLLAWLIVLVIVMAPLPLEAQTGRVVLVLDGSNSMWGRIDGTEKIVVARDVLTQVLSELPADLQIGLAAYGHRREGACDDIEILLPVGDHDRAVVASAIRGVQPRGMTPITGALQLVADALEDADGPTHLVLVSDGKASGTSRARHASARPSAWAPSIGARRASLAVSARFAFFANETAPGRPPLRERLALSCLDQPAPENSTGAPADYERSAR
jgi:hypothetical protein